jgi:hypothetical protein
LLAVVSHAWKSTQVNGTHGPQMGALIVSSGGPHLSPLSSTTHTR